MGLSTQSEYRSSKGQLRSRSGRRKRSAALVIAAVSAAMLPVSTSSAATKVLRPPKVTLEISNGGPYRTSSGSDVTVRLSAAVKGQAKTNRDLAAIGSALAAYRNANGSYPPAALSDASGQPLLSWRVLLLPYLGYSDLFEKFDLTKPWDDPINRSLLRSIPDVYRGATQPRSSTTTAYVGVGSSKGLFRAARSKLGDGVTATNVVDGLEMTAAIGPAGSALKQQWTAPGDLDAIANPTLGTSKGFDGPGSGFTPLLFLDGAVHTIPDTTNSEFVREWFSIASAVGCTPPRNLALGLAAAWDLDGDGTFETTGFTATIAGVTGTRSVRYLVADSFGGQRTGTARVSAK